MNFNDYPNRYLDSEGNEHKLNVESIPSIVYFSEDKK